MQSIEGYYQTQPPPGFSLKRRSRSPSPQSNKRRVPSSYAPTIYTTLAPPLGNNGARTFSTEAIASTPASERSSPGLDWLQRTQDLQLQTPPLHVVRDANGVVVARDRDGDVGMSGGGGASDIMQDDDPQQLPIHSPRPAAPFSFHASSNPPSLQSFLAQTAPHDAPPLHQHLAGSPQASGMSRSSSSSSVQSMHFAAAPTFPTLPTHHEQQDAMMTPVNSPTKRQGGTGGWKVTMGYRPDCPKCQQRVPGHYSHVVYTE
ncbi:hypothetical protein RTBOTA2_001675 [Rhodotorula toruloides]|nr:hypothetical protein RTBOTA2_001675 [Rhodotorula toruloides]